jgi:HEAT repeat protein
VLPLGQNKMLRPLPDEFVQVLAQKLRDDQLVLFAGAGLSMQAKARDGSRRRMPSWNELLEGVADRFGLQPAHFRMDRLTLLDAAEIKVGRAELNDAVRQIIADDAFVPGEAHAALKELPWAAICTTNYDTLLDRCLGCSPIVTEEDFQQMRLPRAQWGRLFKLHGSIDNPHTLTARDYKRWAERHRMAHHFVKDLLLKDTFLFVGYSLSDPHWKALLELVETFIGSDEKWLYALVWQASEAELEPLRLIHRINGAGLSQDSQYAEAFRQIGDAVTRLAIPTPRSPVEPSAFSYDRAQYAQSVRRIYGYADLGAIYQWGAGFARDDVPLADVFVEPDLLLPPTDKKDEDKETRTTTRGETLSELELERRRHARQSEAERSRRRSAGSIAAEAVRLLIVGAPGQGKSTLLRYLLLEATERWLVDPIGSPFPCLIRLSQWTGTDGPPEGRLLRYVREHLPGLAEISQEAAAAWYAGKVLWLLDGIDEIRGAAARERFREELVRLAIPGSRHSFIVSTRPAGEPRGGLGAEWLRTELPALAEPHVLSILRNWSSVLYKKDALHLDATDFAMRLSLNQGLRQVRGNALLLTMAVLFFKQRKRLPNDRWEFYDGAEQSLRDSWARHRLNDRDAAALPGDYAATVLELLALDGMCEGRVLFDTAEVVAKVRFVLTGRNYSGGEQDSEVPRFIDAARDAIGILVEQAPDKFGFVHLTFQEFLAARALVKRGTDAPDIIARFWDHPDWRDTWLLYALGCQALQGRFAELFDVIRARQKPEQLDAALHRIERAALRLAGVGSEQLPSSVDFAIQWAREVLESTNSHRHWMALQIFGSWERNLPGLLRESLVALIGIGDFRSRAAVVQSLGAHSHEEIVRTALLKSFKDRSAFVRAETVRSLTSEIDNEAAQQMLFGARRDRSAIVRAAALDALSTRSENMAIRAMLFESLKDRDGGIRVHAMRALALYGIDSEIRSVIFNAMLDSNINFEAQRILNGWAGDRIGRTTLLEATRDKRVSVRLAALRALTAHTGYPDVLSALLTAASDSHWSVREAALRTIIRSGRCNDARTVLVHAISDTAASVRSAAVQGLSMCADKASFRDIFITACGDNHWSVRRAAALALAVHAQDSAIRTKLAGLCNDRNESVRAGAFEALTNYAEDEDVRSVLLRGAGQRGWSCYAALEALSDHAHDTAVRDVLLSALEDERDYVRAEAIDALTATLNDPIVVSAVIAAANHGGTWSRQKALNALARLSNQKEVRATLISACNDSETSVRQAAVQVLATLDRAHDFRDALLTACGDAHWVIRQEAANALATYVEEGSVRDGLLALCEDDDEDVRQAAVRALEAWLVRQKFPRTMSA